jgi:fatty-acyl-CoA synthase
MHGLMQHHELLISSVLEHAARHHGDGEVVSRRPSGALERTSYAALSRTRPQAGIAVARAWLAAGDRVATLAMNSDRHLELYYAISGSGLVCNTINPASVAGRHRLYRRSCRRHGDLSAIRFPAHRAGIAPGLEILRMVVVLCDAAAMPKADMPASVLLHCYEDLMEDGPAHRKLAAIRREHRSGFATPPAPPAAQGRTLFPPLLPACRHDLEFRRCDSVFAPPTG